ncbi:Fluconazole resistance protein 1 [Exophiala xenobiotica]|uniref:Fluconazole resistance protein 1 n=1 Tax=Lithohypha guttulata TaxID=1690604 RepID=A0ABR0JVQ0_9EURO|nr:Fluconazole resistance protein 1 [Lithohypha guttulata]KAK5309253.1 Fluconazole resistance protein 1 [Exophiala xenobiotica]
MGSRTTSPPSEPLSPLGDRIRKRVCKACDRCRLKKSKCDGTSPCHRCKADNAICVFDERKKSHDKAYPKGYVGMLENQQVQLVQGLRELYRRVNSGEGWVGASLRETNGLPLTHDILERLGALNLKQEGQTHSAQFEEDFLALQCRMIAAGAGYMQRSMSFDTDAEADQSPVFEPAVHDTSTFTNPFASHLPPTPPLGSPRVSFVKANLPLKTHTNTSAPQVTQQSLWQTGSVEIESMDKESPSFDANMQAMNLPAQTSTQMFQENVGMAMDPCMTMNNWHGPDDNMQQYYQGGVYT